MSVHQNFVASPIAAPVASLSSAASNAPIARVASAAPNAPIAHVAAAPARARAARMARFEREQVVVEYLNRGVSVVEIAARIGVGEKRMRAIIREILARRMPHPPAEFVAIQLSRLNEALLVAYSAMSPTNLKAVAQVVKIVHELDRYGGAFAAEWARPEALGLEAQADEAAGDPWLSGEDPGPDDDEALLAPLARPDIPPQRLEKAQSAPGFAPFAAPGPELVRTDAPRPVLAAARSSLPDRRRPQGETERAGERPEIPAQSLEKVQSAPGFVPLAPAEPEAVRTDGPRPALAAGCPALPDRPRPQGEAGRPGERPDIPAQGLEKARSAPGIGTDAEAASAASVPASDPVLSLLDGEAGRPDLAATWRMLRQRSRALA